MPYCINCDMHFNEHTCPTCDSKLNDNVNQSIKEEMKRHKDFQDNLFKL